MPEQPRDLVYVASPYSHPDPAVRQARFEAVCRVAATLLRAGHAVFCPIAHSHPIATLGDIGPTDHDFWLAADTPLLLACRSMVVVRRPGWGESRGIQEELRIAAERGIPVAYMDPAE